MRILKADGIISALRARLERASLLFVAWMALTMPAFLTVSGLRATALMLRVGLLLVGATAIVSRLQWVPWPPDADRLKRAFLTAFGAQVVGTPLLLATSSGGLWWVTVLGFVTVQRVYAERLSPASLGSLVAAYLLCTGAWLAVTGFTSFSFPAELRSLDPMALAQVGFVISALGAIASEFQDGLYAARPEEILKKPYEKAPADRNVGCAAIVFPFAAAALGYAGFVLHQPVWKGLLGATALAVGAGVGLTLGDRVGARLARSLAIGTLHRIAALFSLADYLADRTKLLGAFAIGYGLLAVWFAGAFRLAARADANAFHGLSRDDGFMQFFYFSAITLATVGYGDIVPVSRAARLLVVLEVGAGLLWTTVIFAGIVWLIQAYRPADLAAPRDSAARGGSTSTAQPPSNHQCS